MKEITKKLKTRGDWLSLALAIGIPFVGGAVGGIATAFNLKWYHGLKKPSWNPPDWLFGPAWSVLYAAMGVSSWLVWKTGGWAKQALPLGMYSANVAFNWSWTLLFFGLRRADIAMADIAALWATTVGTIATFYPVSPLASYLLLPYLGWVSFATALNWNLWRGNPEKSIEGPPKRGEEEPAKVRLD